MRSTEKDKGNTGGVRASFSARFWQRAGVVIGALGVILTVVTLARDTGTKEPDWKTGLEECLGRHGKLQLELGENETRRLDGGPDALCYESIILRRGSTLHLPFPAEKGALSVDKLKVYPDASIRATGTDGRRGADGLPGEDGSKCTNGTSGTRGQKGSDGTNGVNLELKVLDLVFFVDTLSGENHRSALFKVDTSAGSGGAGGIGGDGGSAGRGDRSEGCDGGNGGRGGDGGHGGHGGNGGHLLLSVVEVATKQGSEVGPADWSDWITHQGRAGEGGSGGAGGVGGSGGRGQGANIFGVSADAGSRGDRGQPGEAGRSGRPGEVVPKNLPGR